ncbi:pyridoxal phosphate-dependent aminotransferase [Lentzea sp. JNUCC 0626]|uniref:pyridoxal phosphate-dependent aminotransferase n=1 Tax=Lentzea sp. JNUCC 0626 TaxID=3367513 RepID=UPI003747CEE8
MNPLATALPASGIREVMDLAFGRPDVIRLEIGDPDFATPPHVVEAGLRAASDGATHYVPNTGLPFLREALAAKVFQRNGFAADPGQVFVSQGATQGIYAALAALAAPGDEVLLPDPAWPNYVMMAQLQGLSAVHYPLTAATEFQPDLEVLEGLVTPRTKVLVVNSPSNPIGTVADRERIEALAEFARRHDLWLISDECYDEIVFDAPCTSPAVFAPERTIAVYSFSKTYAMTGWRIGYLVVPRTVAATITKVQETIVACVNAPTQHAAFAALDGTQDCVAHMLACYRERRDLVAQLAKSAGLVMPTPAGAFYGWVDIRDASPGAARDFALGLLASERVAIAPGTAFGALGEGYVRLSLAASPEHLTEGVQRVAAYLEARAERHP